MRKTIFLSALAGVMVSVACHSAKPETTTPPEPSASEIARQKQVQDSLDALAQARTDSLARAQEVALREKQAADSVEAARLAVEAAARDSAEQVKVRMDALRTELTQVIYFETASARLTAEDQGTLDRKAEILASNPGVQLKITGACDERGSEAYNMALGERRAMAVQKYLVTKGVANDRLARESAGEGSPVDPGHDESAWQQNRRAEFAITEGSLALNQ